MPNETTVLCRITLLFGCLLGAFGVMLAAAANHTADTGLLANASAIALAHAPVLIAIAIGWHRLSTARFASIAMMLGTLLFIGDLLCRHFAGHGLFPMAAPTGGIAMMGSWIILAFSAIMKVKQSA